MVPKWHPEPQPDCRDEVPGPLGPSTCEANRSSCDAGTNSDMPSTMDPSSQTLQQGPGQQQQIKDDTTYYGAALGQTGTSTRQELTAWLRVLAIPCRSLYATDSASMLSKAMKLIEAAEKVIREKIAGNEKKRGNPFGKAWGLQTDGDLWEQAWLAVLKRGAGNQTLRKVKGHATEKRRRKLQKQSR